VLSHSSHHHQTLELAWIVCLAVTTVLSVAKTRTVVTDELSYFIMPKSVALYQIVSECIRRRKNLTPSGLLPLVRGTWSTHSKLPYTSVGYSAKCGHSASSCMDIQRQPPKFCPSGAPPYAWVWKPCKPSPQLDRLPCQICIKLFSVN